MRTVLKAFMWFGIAGFLASTVAHVYSFFGRAGSLEPIAWILHVGIFVVWFPAVLVAARLTRNVKQNDFWKAIFLGCPPWVRRGFYVLFPYAIVNFLIAMALLPNGEPNALRMFSGHWMVFYYAGAAILLASQNLEHLVDRTCTQGHPASPFAKFCEECGEELEALLALLRSK